MRKTESPLATHDVEAASPSRQPRVGDNVYFWEGGLRGLNPLPAVLVQPSRDGKWDMTLTKVGLVAPRRDVAFAVTPTLGHWTWRE